MNYKFKSILKLTIFFGLSAIPYQNCGSPMHSSESSLSLASSDTNAQIEQGKTLYLRNCAGCHGPYDTSDKLGRTQGQINLAIQNIPQMSQLTGLNIEQVRFIALALSNQAQAGNVVDNGNNRLIFACEPGTRARTPIQKLNNREFRNSVFSMLDSFDTNLKSDGELNTLLGLMPSDIVLESDHTRKEQSFLLNQGIVSATFNVAYRAGALVANSSSLGTFPNTSGCLGQASVSQTCHQSLVREFGAISFRRPLATAEVTSLSTRFWDSTLSKVDLIHMTITGLLQTPDFIYKVYDRGNQIPATTNTLQLTAHELASKVSYFLTGTPPDSTLRNLATSGEILNNTVLDQQVDRLINSARAREVFARLFRESYGYDIFSNFSYPTSYLEGINTNGLQAAMIDELDQYFFSEINTQNSTFAQLLTSRRSQISNTSLAQIYESTTGTVQLPAERSGFLNRAAFLTKRSGLRASPIKRGLVVLENVLCTSVGLPPPNAPTALPDLPAGVILSTREVSHRNTETAGTSCVNCHSRINPLGYAFEGFDTLGRLRTVETIYDSTNTAIGQVPVVTQSSSADLGTRSVSYSNSVDLATELGRSDRAMLCFAKQLKAFESRRPATASDNCHMNEIVSTLYGTNQGPGTVKAAVKRFIMSDQFKYWNY